MFVYNNPKKDLARNILQGLALSLVGSPDEFEDDKAGDPFWVMRVIGNPGQPNFDAVIQPLEFRKQKAGGIQKCESAVYGEHLVRKVLTNIDL